MEKSNLDVAFELVSRKKNPVVFSKLWEEVSQIQGLSEGEAKKRASKFYTALSLDGRFITLGDNTWDLRSRYTFDKVHIDMNEVYSDEADEVEDEDRSDDDYFNDDEESDEDEEDDDEERSSEDY